MNYEKAYNETLEQLYLEKDRVTGYELKEERIDMLFAFQKVVERLISDRTLGIPTLNEGSLTTLVQAFNQYGSFYFSELAARRELFNKDKELFAAYEVIRKQKEEITSLEQALEFLKPSTNV